MYLLSGSHRDELRCDADGDFFGRSTADVESDGAYDSVDILMYMASCGQISHKKIKVSGRTGQLHFDFSSQSYDSRVFCPSSLRNSEISSVVSTTPRYSPSAFRTAKYRIRMKASPF